MLLTTLALVLLAMPAPPASPTPSPELRLEQRGVQWFEGGLEEALLEAERSSRIVLVELETPACRSCEKLAREVLSVPSILAELGELICVRLNGESEAGKKVVERYGVASFPTFLIFQPDGSPRDGFVGYRPSNLFRRELVRIKSGRGTIPAHLDRISANPVDPRLRLDLIVRLEVFGMSERIAAEKQLVRDLIARCEGFEPDSVEDRWQLYTRLRSAGMKTLAAEQVARIVALDPESRTLPGRKVVLEKLLSALKLNGDGSALRSFLAVETNHELLFEGELWIQRLCKWSISRAKNDQEVASLRRSWRESARRVWENVPDEQRAIQGNNIAWEFYLNAESLTQVDRLFALELAATAVSLAPEEVNTIDTYACCLSINGDLTEAIVQIRRCLDLDPSNEMWKTRLRSFSEKRDGPIR
jgi:hypothetical protein